ncbi:MAG TPA: hypothetical protein VLB68_18510 [Pyrinomonadaceae bacterium]|nr:hypothetical protein [Pyrinomonadaceae bacterium]
MKKVFLVAAALLISLLGACNSDLQTTLKLGRLAAIPASASELKLDGTSNLFSSTYFIRFRATAKDIDDFVRNSPGLRGVTPTRFDANHQLLPFTNDDEMRSTEHEYFGVDKRYPWFNPVIKKRGRKYEIPQDHDANYGEVIIDDELNVVYITVSHS